MFTISDTVKSWTLKIAALALCAGLVWANYEIIDAKNTRIDSLATEVSNQKGKVTALEEELAKKVKSEVVTEAVKEEVKVAEVKVVKAKTEASVYVEKKVAEIDAKYDALPVNPSNDSRKAVEKSLERSKGMWMTYCLQEPTVSACLK